MLYTGEGLLWLMQLSLHASPACRSGQQHKPAALLPLWLRDQVHPPAVMVRKEWAVALSHTSRLPNR